MKLLLVEPGGGGHHLTFLAGTLDALALPGVQLLLATSQSNAEALAAQQLRFEWIDDASWNRRSPLADIAREVATHAVDHVYHGNLDAFMSGLLRRCALGYRPPNLLRKRISGLYVRPRPLDRRQPWSIKRVGARRLFGTAGYFDRIFTFDETLAEQLLVDQAVAVLPDPPFHVEPSCSAVAARERFGIPQQSSVCLQYGLGTRRKGLCTAIEAFEQLKALHHLLCVGRLGLDRQWSGRLHRLVARGVATLVDAYVDQQDEARAFAAADLVLLDYHRHYGSSNVLALAASYGKPVITANDGLVGYRCERYRLGVSITPDRPDLLRQAIIDGQSLTATQAGRQAYLDVHSVERFAQVLREHLLPAR